MSTRSPGGRPLVFLKRTTSSATAPRSSLAIGAPSSNLAREAGISACGRGRKWVAGFGARDDLACLARDTLDLVEEIDDLRGHRPLEGRVLDRRQVDEDVRGGAARRRLAE